MHRRNPRALAERFFDLTIPEPNSGCLLWLGACNGGSNRPHIRIGGRDGRHFYATHVALQLAGRPLPPGMFACHACDNQFCVEERHLFHGDHAANIADHHRKGLHRHGGGHHNAKLTESDVVEIKRRLAAGEYHRSIAARFGVSRVTITDIAVGRTWPHVGEG